MARERRTNDENLQMTLDVLPRKAVIVPEKNVKVAREFIMGHYKPTLLEFKTFLAITTVYEQNNTKDFYNIVKFKFLDLANTIGLNKEAGYTKKLETILTQLSDRKIRIQTRKDEDEEKDKWIVGHFLSSIEAMGDGTVELLLDPKLVKYFTNLTKEYTYLEIQTLLNFSSTYSIRIFNLMKQYKQKHKTFSVADLKEMLEITNKYKNFADFKRFVLEPAVKDINEHSTMKISYETDGSKGKKVTTVTFNCVENYIMPEGSDENMRKAFDTLIFYKVNKNVALDIVKKFSLNRIENNIQYIITTYSGKKEKRDLAKLIVSAIKEDYAGNSWGLQSIDDEKVQEEINEQEKNSRAYDEYIKKIKTDEEAEKLFELVKENIESTLLYNQLNALKLKYTSLELMTNKLFKSIAAPVMKNENLI